MMLRYSFNLRKEADCVEEAVNRALKEGYRTSDIARNTENPISTKEMTEIIKGFI